MLTQKDDEMSDMRQELEQLRSQNRPAAGVGSSAGSQKSGSTASTSSTASSSSAATATSSEATSSADSSSGAEEDAITAHGTPPPIGYVHAT